MRDLQRVAFDVVKLRLRTLDALSILPAVAGGRLAALLRRKTLAKLSALRRLRACNRTPNAAFNP